MNFIETIEYYQEIINKALERYLNQKLKELPSFGNSFVKTQHQLFSQYCLRNGKRLRPILTLMAYRAVGGQNEINILMPALAFELFHNYTLIHDDIYDEDEKRRGEWSNHILLQRWFEKKYPKSSLASTLYKNSATRFGVVAGIINGKYLHALSSLPILEADISEEKKLAGIKLYQDVSIYDNTGQAIDLAFEQDFKVTEKDYCNMVLCKTGQLFKAATEWGAVLGGANASQKEALRKYAEEISIVFQIKDDLLDIASGGEKGRGVGSDIKKGKKTLLIIHALGQADAKKKKFILEVLGNQGADEAEIKKVIGWLENLGSVDFCRKKALGRVAAANACLERARPALEAQTKQFFKDLARFMLERNK